MHGVCAYVRVCVCVWRLQVGGADVILMDGMLDCSALAAEVRRGSRSPKIVVYAILTAPFYCATGELFNCVCLRGYAGTA